MAEIITTDEKIRIKAPRWLHSRFMPASPAITAGLVVMPLAIAAGYLADRAETGADLELRPTMAAADSPADRADTERFAGRIAGLMP